MSKCTKQSKYSAAGYAPNNRITCHILLDTYHLPLTTRYVPNNLVTLTAYYTHYTRYVPNNRPRVPPFKISDDLSESSSEDETIVDEAFQRHRLTKPPTPTPTPDPDPNP